MWQSLRTWAMCSHADRSCLAAIDALFIINAILLSSIVILLNAIHKGTSLSPRTACLYLLPDASAILSLIDNSNFGDKDVQEPRICQVCNRPCPPSGCHSLCQRGSDQALPEVRATMPKLQKLDSSAILTWFGLYNKIKDVAKRADDELLNPDGQ